MTLDELLEKEGKPISRHPNKRTMPIYRIHANTEGAQEWNKYFYTVKSWRKIKRTPSGGISTDVKNFYPPMWDATCIGTIIELTIIGLKKMLRIQFTSCKDTYNTDIPINGKMAFQTFLMECKKWNIDLNTYKISNGKEIKETIEKPLINLDNKGYRDAIFYGCHHIDFHNSYPAGLVNTHPEFKDVIEYFYKKRKENPIYKAVLNLTIGFFQSYKPYLGRYADWAHLSRDAIADNNRRIRELAARLQKSGRIIIAYNTDGIWYKGDIFHGEGEGKGLGEWENDHTNCKIRFKSAGSYEYIETDEEGNETYHPVVRGETKLDKVRPRSMWKWGDIYNDAANEIIKFYFDSEEGIIQTTDFDYSI